MHKIYIVGAFISAQALRLLMVYSRERATKDKQLTLEEIVGFLNRIEQNVGEAALQNVVSMPQCPGAAICWIAYYPGAIQYC